MAKPRRMHVMIAAALLSALEPRFGWPRGSVLLAGLAVVTIGDIATIASNAAAMLAASLNLLATRSKTTCCGLQAL